jgi:hypothetical protein
MSLRKNNKGTLNAEEFKEMITSCRELVCSIIVELQIAADEHEKSPADDGPVDQLFWIEGHLMAALDPIEFRGAEMRSEEERAEGPSGEDVPPA